MSEQQGISRHIPFQGTPNFRDYGGYQTDDGRMVKWRRLFRSGQLSALTDDDQDQFANLDIRMVFDFRHDQERDNDPSRLPAAIPAAIVNLPINPGSSVSSLDKILTAGITFEQMAELMCAINRELAISQSGAYRQMFEHLLNHEEGGSLVHCSAGKDRTGFAAAMVLSVLGVPRETILVDYMLSAKYFNIDSELDRASKKYRWQADRSALVPMLEVRETYLGTAFEAIEQEYSSVECYLEDVLGIGSQEKTYLQERYLTASNDF